MHTTDIGLSKSKRRSVVGAFGIWALLALVPGCTNALALGDGNNPELEAETIKRWNARADTRAQDTYDFHWVHNEFPHPTFAGMGEAEGYREFAVLLNDFLGFEGNFDFLDEHHLFRSKYYYVTESTSDQDLVVTWQDLATDFSTGFGAEYGAPSEDVKASLADFAMRMRVSE